MNKKLIIFLSLNIVYLAIFTFVTVRTGMTPIFELVLGSLMILGLSNIIYPPGFVARIKSGDSLFSNRDNNMSPLIKVVSILIGCVISFVPLAILYAIIKAMLES